MAAADRELRQVEETFKSIKKPSGAWHLARMAAAGTADALDVEAVVEMTAEVAAAPAPRGASLAVAAARWYADNAKDLAFDAGLALSEIPLNHNKKKLNKFSNLIVAVIQAGQRRIDARSAELSFHQSRLYQLTGVMQQRQQYAAAQVSGTVVPIQRWQAPKNQQARARQIGSKMRSIGARMSKSRIVLKSAWLKKIGGYIADFIPWLEALPWRTWNVWVSHRQYKKTYEQILKDHQECVAFKNTEPKILEELARAIATTNQDIEYAQKQLADIEYRLSKAA